MEDALAIIGQWIGLVKSAKLSIAEVSRDCEERVAAGVVSAEDDFQEAVSAVFEALSTLPGSFGRTRGITGNRTGR